MPRLPDKITVGDVALRRMGPEHLDDLLKAIARSKEELERWLPFAVGEVSRDAEAGFLDRAASDFEADRDYSFVVVDSQGTIVGNAALHPTGSWAGIGYWTATSHSRRGQATAVAAVLTEQAFDRLRVQSVQIHCDAANHASAAVPARLGFRLVGGQAREVLTPGHTGWGLVWQMDRNAGPARSTLVIRTVEAADVEALVGAFEGGDYLSSRFKEQSVGLTEVIMATEADEPVGEVCLRFGEPVEGEVAARLPGVPYLSDLEVSVGHREKGIGARLVLAGESRALGRGADQIYVGVEPDNQGARRLYERLGYVEWPFGEVRTHSTYTLDGVEREGGAVVTVLVKTLRRQLPPSSETPEPPRP